MDFPYRGQESAGIVTSEGNNAKSFHVHKGMGMINNVFSDDSMKKLKGKRNCELFKLVKSDITSIQEISSQVKTIKIAVI